MEYSGSNAGGTSGRPSWPGALPQQREEIAQGGHGITLALGGAAAVALGALLPFISNVQITDGGIPVGNGGVSGGDRVLSFLFALILAGLALWIRYRPEFRRRIAIASLIASALGLAGYFIFTVVGLAHFTVQSDSGPTQYAWDPSIGVVLSIGGCAACLISAIAMLRARTAAPAGPGHYPMGPNRSF